MMATKTASVVSKLRAGHTVENKKLVAEATAIRAKAKPVSRRHESNTSVLGEIPSQSISVCDDDEAVDVVGPPSKKVGQLLHH